MRRWLVVLDTPVDADGGRVRDRDRGDWEEMRRNAPKKVFFTEAAAQLEAEQLATKNPQVPVYIFEAVRVLETAEPQFRTKKFNSTGELLPA